MIRHILDKKSKLKKNIILFIFFTILAFTGTQIYHFYGISIDEAETRSHGFMALQHIYEKFFPLKLTLLEHMNIPNYSDFESRNHGVILDLFYAQIEVFFEISQTRNQFLFRHFGDFMFFFIGVYFFYLIGKFRFNDWRIGLLGSIFLVLSPRIFAESFYNNKDIIFMSLYIISLYCCFKFIYKPNIKHAIFFSLTSALATDIRLMGILVPFLTLFIFIFSYFRDTNFFKKKLLPIISFIFLFPVFTIIFWPYLWTDPFSNFFVAFKQLASYPWEGKNLYFGNYVSTINLPWHYSLTWILITTPVIYSILFILGFSISTRRFINRIFNINDQNSINDLWRGKKESIDIIILLTFFVPIFLVIIFNSTLHDGWRQLYFVYPSFLLLSIYGFEKIYRKLRGKKLQSIFLILIISTLIINLINMIKIHPYQYAYFNFLVGKQVEKKFDIDYWGVSNKQALKFILSNNNQEVYKIYPASNMNLNISKLILSEKQKAKIHVVDVKSEADFIITNGRFWKGNDDADFAQIPKSFRIYKEILTDRAKLVTIYKKIE